MKLHLKIERLKLVAVALAMLVTSCSEKEPPQKPAAIIKPEATNQPPTVTTPSQPKATETNEPVSKPTVAEPAKPVVVSTLAAYFHFDEERRSKSVVDSSPRKLTAHLNDGVTAGADGYVKAALDFSTQKVGMVTLSDPLDFATNTATVVVWAKRRGPQEDKATLFFARGGDSSAGIITDEQGQLSYVWGRERTSEGWVSGLVLPDNEWVFVALVVEPRKATMYLGVPGQSLWSAENAKLHAPADFAGSLTLGRDPIIDSTFEGSIDEFGIWKNSMSREEVEKLFTVGQKLAAAQAEQLEAARQQRLAAEQAAKLEAARKAQLATAQPAKPVQTAAAQVTRVATKQEKTPEAVARAEQPQGEKPAQLAASGAAAAPWNRSEFEATARRYNEAVDAFGTFLRTRQGGAAALRKIEDDVRACADSFEMLKPGAPSTLNIQTYVDRCNKLNFDIHAAKTLAP